MRRAYFTHSHLVDSNPFYLPNPTQSHARISPAVRKKLKKSITPNSRSNSKESLKVSPHHSPQPSDLTLLAISKNVGDLEPTEEEDEENIGGEEDEFQTISSSETLDPASLNTEDLNLPETLKLTAKKPISSKVDSDINSLPPINGFGELSQVSLSESGPMDLSEDFSQQLAQEADDATREQSDQPSNMTPPLLMSKSSVDVSSTNLKNSSIEVTKVEFGKVADYFHLGIKDRVLVLFNLCEWSLMDHPELVRAQVKNEEAECLLWVSKLVFFFLAFDLAKSS